jgi:hypothetical protein
MARQSVAERFLMYGLAALLLAAVMTVPAARSSDRRVPSAAGSDEEVAALLPPGDGVLASTAKVSRGELSERNERTRRISAPMGLAIASSFLSAIMSWSVVQARRSRAASFLHPYIDGARAPPLQLD